MTEEQQTLAEIRAHIAALPADVNLQVIRCADAYRSIIALAPQAGEMALALIGAELAARS